MDKTQAETQKLDDTVAAVESNAVASEKPAEETAKPTTVAADEEGVKKEADEPAAAAAAAPEVLSKDESKAVKQENEEEPKPSDAPAAEGKPEKGASTESKPSFLADKPELEKLFTELPYILEKAKHSEMWGVTLKDWNDAPTANVLIKFLRANEGDRKLAEEQLIKALEWRRKIEPVPLARSAKFSNYRFGGLGYITTYNEGKDVFTWNVYGAVKEINRTFGDVDEFIRWRVALMELAIQELKLNEATTVIDYDGEDPYQMFQVHDYQNVSFLRMNPTIRIASRRTIEVFSMAYPELLKEKFFVNVPAVMGWMFAAMKVFLSKNTTRKFHPIANGANLAREFTDFGEALPKTYGGKGAELQEDAKTVLLEMAEGKPPGSPEESSTPTPKESSTPAPKESSTPAPKEPSTEEPSTAAPKEAPATGATDSK